MRMIYVNGALLGTAALAGVLAIPAPAQSGILQVHADHVLGTSLDVTAVAKDDAAAALALGVVQEEISRLDRVLSTWRESSELKTLNVSRTMQVSPDLFHVIAACEKWRRLTGGAYSARIGALLEGLCNNVGASDPDTVQRMAQAIASAEVPLEPASRTIARPDSVVFAVDGLAKGYIIDRALAAARCVSPNLEGMMIDIGGDVRCWGRSPTGDGWKIGVAVPGNNADNGSPDAVLRIADKAVATSGKGQRAPSLLSPATGELASHIAQATVIADDAADADVLATAFTVMAPEDSMALAARLPGVAARVVTADGKCFTSSEWNCYLNQETRGPRLIQIADTAAGDAWPQGFAVGIGYEIPPLNAGRRREGPYVTLWITDPQNNLVRTLAFFGGKRRYFDENYVFWRRFAARNQAVIDSVTRPTRLSGNYVLLWDGLDDRGSPVPQGKYTLFIEASREHGGHSLQRIDLNIGTQEFTTGATGEGELGDTKVIYGKSN